MVKPLDTRSRRRRTAWGRRAAYSFAGSPHRRTASASSGASSWRSSGSGTTSLSSTTRRSAHSGDSEQSRTWWRIGPGDEDFLTQTIQVHFVELPPQSSNHGHGHQNEAAFYILEGRGYEIHDDQRYDWAKDDLVYVHTDSVHRHFNPYDEKASPSSSRRSAPGCSWA